MGNVSIYIMCVHVTRADYALVIVAAPFVDGVLRGSQRTGRQRELINSMSSPSPEVEREVSMKRQYKPALPLTMSQKFFRE